MAVEQVKQLGLQRRTRPVRVEVREEGVVGVLEDNGRVQARAEPLGECGLTRANGPFDRDVAKLQDGADDIIAPVFSVSMRPRLAVVLAIVCHAIACVSAPPAPAARATPAPPAQPFEQKMAWILRLEDQRVLRDPSSATAAASATGGNTAVTPPTADLGRLLTDPEARVRRRAALAVGRVGLREGAPLLIALLNDSDPEVRQMAAFALGLIGDRIARDPLVTALDDQSPLVQGSAAEALGLLGDPAAAAPVGAMVSRLMGTLADLPGRRRRVETRHAVCSVPSGSRGVSPSESL